MEDKGVVVDHEALASDGLVELQSVWGLEVNQPAAGPTVKVVVRACMWVEPVGRGEGDGGDQRLFGQGTKGPIHRGQTDLLSLGPELKVQLLRRGMIHAPGDGLEHYLPLARLLLTHDFHYHYKTPATSGQPRVQDERIGC